MVPSEDTVMTLGTGVANRRYCNDTTVPVEPTGDTIVTLVYQWINPEILWYTCNTRVLV